MIQLSNEQLRIRLAPEMGVCILSFEVMLNGEWQPIMRPTPAGAASRDSSSYLLAPYSNRIRNRRFVFMGQAFELRPNWPDGQTMHGDVQTRPWQVVQHNATVLRCAIDSRNFSGANFPFQYMCETSFQLNANTLTIDLSLTNADSRLIPAGIGHHPYFTRFINGEDARIQFNVAKVYLAEDPIDPIPVAAAVPITQELNFSDSRPLGQQKIDHVFNGWDGNFEMCWSGLRLNIQASQIFSHLVVYAAPDNTLAVEPVSHATDGFNLMAQGVQGLGVKVLQPGETISGSVKIQVFTGADR